MSESKKHDRPLTVKQWKALLKKRIKKLTRHLSVIERLKKGSR